MPGMLMMRPADGNETAGAYQIGRADRPPHHLRALPPGCPQPRRHLQGGCPQGCVRRRGPRRRRGLRLHHHRHRHRAPARRQRGQGARRQGPRGLHALLGALRGAVDEYKASILPKGVPTVSIEAGSTFGWSKYADISIGRDDFGASAPAGILYKEFGITTEAAVKAAKSLM